MVRPANVARSRACDQCRRKRIKCDLQAPSCQRCIESSLVCSGPISGLLMVNTSSSTFTQSSTRPRVSSRPDSHGSARQHSNSDLVRYRTPSTNLIFEETLLWTFLGFFTQNAAKLVWSDKLPQLRSAKNASAMKSAAKAVSLAFAAQNMNDTTLAATACEFYGESLRFHQKSFIAPEGRAICRKKAVNAVPVTVLLSYFEMIQPTSADAWIRHTTAAERLFLLLGPDYLKDDLLNHLYFIVKSNAVIRSFITGSKTQLYGHPWSNVRMNHACGWAVELFDDCVDLIARLSPYFTFPFSSSTATAEMVSPEALQFHIAELDILWTALDKALGLEPLKPLWMRSELISDTPSSEDDIPDRPKHLEEPHTTLTLAFFHAATTQILTLIYSSSSSSEINRFSATDIASAVSYHSVQILSCTKHLTRFPVGCTCLRMLLPIKTVYNLSRNPQEKKLARSLFDRWSKTSNLPGLSDIAAFDDTTDEHVSVMPYVVSAQEIVRQVNWMVDLPG